MVRVGTGKVCAGGGVSGVGVGAPRVGVSAPVGAGAVGLAGAVGSAAPSVGETRAVTVMTGVAAAVGVMAASRSASSRACCAFRMMALVWAIPGANASANAMAQAITHSNATAVSANRANGEAANFSSVFCDEVFLFCKARSQAGVGAKARVPRLPRSISHGYTIYELVVSAK